jgi:allantoinase
VLDLVVRGATVVTRDGVRRADVGVEDGAIAAVGSVGGNAREELDASGLHVFPGGMDPHVHFNEPGRTEWEGFHSGSRALAAGGFTTFVDMPLNSVPATTDAAGFDAKLAAARGASHVDFALWGGLVPDRVDRLEELHERGVLGFKAFMCDSGVEEFPRIDDASLLRGMERVAELGSIVLLHAENPEIVAALAEEAVAAGRVSARDFAASRPVVAELEAIDRALFFAGETGCSLHIVHVSTARGVRMVEDARRHGVDATCETCPHYLLLTEDDLDRLGPVAKCAPPVRRAADRDELWRLLGVGTLPFVASDHSPSSPELKEGDDYFAIWGGISGCQSTLGLLLEHGHARRGLPLETIAAITSSGVWQRFPLEGKRGLEPGADADLAVVDLGESWDLEASELLYRHPVSPYVGERMRGRVVRTLVRGHSVYDRAGGFGQPAGRFVRRAAGPVRRHRG